MLPKPLPVAAQFREFRGDEASWAVPLRLRRHRGGGGGGGGVGWARARDGLHTTHDEFLYGQTKANCSMKLWSTYTC